MIFYKRVVQKKYNCDKSQIYHYQLHLLQSDYNKSQIQYTSLIELK